MARIEFGAVDGLMRQLERESERVQRNGEAAVTAGAAIAVDAMQQTVSVSDGTGHGHYGHLRDHIKAHKPKYSTANGWTCEVYPDGTRGDGQRYATVGFVLEYGRSDMEPRPWMRPAVETHTGEITEAMKRELMK